MGKKGEKEIRITTLLGKGSEVKGDFTAQDSARIDGKVDGNVTVNGYLILGAGASVAGDVTAHSALIGGEVLGNVTVQEKTELTETAKVLGNISTKVIVIDENAVFQGMCNMNQSLEEPKAVPARAVRATKRSAKAALAEALREVAAEAGREEQESEDGLKEENTSGPTAEA